MSRRNLRGLTLLETLVFVVVFSLLAVGIMRSLGDGRVLLANARARVQLCASAQSELDRLRATSEPLEIGSSRHEVGDGSFLDVVVADHDEELLSLRVEASRPAAKGLRPVVLETLARRVAP